VISSSGGKKILNKGFKFEAIIIQLVLINVFRELVEWSLNRQKAKSCFTNGQA